MRFVFGYAGISSGAYDYIYARRKDLIGDYKQNEFEGVSLGQAESAALTPKHSSKLLHRFKHYAFMNRGGESSIGFAVIYVRSDPVSSAQFEEAFFPSTLVFPVDWHLTGTRSHEINRSYKELFDLLLEATGQARIAINALHKEVAERANRTPLLLPIRNFRSKELQNWMLELQASLTGQQNASTADSAIKSAVKKFEAVHSLKKVDGSRSSCYIDNHDVEFHLPGKMLHGMPHPTNDHPPNCILSAYRRLGAPFNAAFHYDCVKGKRGNLKGMFYTCHEAGATHMEGDPHINIAPNDFIRI